MTSGKPHVSEACAETARLRENAQKLKHWRRWGPYLSERQWGTVREDYSKSGDAWRYLTHTMARSYAYRWGEDGLGGISDNHQRLCLAPSFWNGEDEILKERLFGVSGHEGNHGEEVKEVYWHLENLPSHAWMVYRYRYPQQAFPYKPLTEENMRRSRHQPAYQLMDTGIFEENRFFDIDMVYAKGDDDDLLARITATNRGPESRPLHLIPTLWFRNDWSWSPQGSAPVIRKMKGPFLHAHHRTLGDVYLCFSGDPKILFTENLTNTEKLYGTKNPGRYVKDAFHRRIVEQENRTTRSRQGTKCGLWYTWTLAPGESRSLTLRLSEQTARQIKDSECADLFKRRKQEADSFYRSTITPLADLEEQDIASRALAGMLWTKQWYHFDVSTWLKGDPTMPSPPDARNRGRNQRWTHMYADDVLSMPDAWEYPWFAVWDSAFHAVSFSLIDPVYARRQITRFLREWYMHPNGQLPAYEWSLDDVNPPVQAWAAREVYRIAPDFTFLESVFHKLLMNFTWWVNRKDPDENNIFEGGFLGLDNIGIFDRSSPPPTGGQLFQSDATSWMVMYSLNMLGIACDLSHTNPVYEDIASKFYEHFLHIASAMNNAREERWNLWDEVDGFFYDQLVTDDGHRKPIRIRSLVGLIPLLAVELLDEEDLAPMPGFKRRMDWFNKNRPDLTRNINCIFNPEGRKVCLLSLLKPDQFVRVLKRMFDEEEFLSPYGIRSLSKYYEKNPYTFDHGAYTGSVCYEPGESSSPLFGGNSNWRGPVWLPMNYLIIQALRRYHAFWGDDWTIEYPTGSGVRKTLNEIADDISRRLIALFKQGPQGKPIFGSNATWQQDENWNRYPLYFEYFHGDTGQGLGASHQTGWTGLVANLIQDLGQYSLRSDSE